MAPEQIRSHTYDSRVDLYALGIILLEMVTGLRAFSDTDEARTMFRVLIGQIQDGVLERAPAELRSIIHRLIAVEPSARPTSAADICLELAPLRDTATARVELSQLIERWRNSVGAETTAKLRTANRSVRTSASTSAASPGALRSSVPFAGLAAWWRARWDSDQRPPI
jgi:serine/threonine-protein kinase